MHRGLCVLAFLLAACGSSRACRNQNQAPSYANDIQGLVAAKCEVCHGAAVKGADRHGAPVEINYDTYDLLKEQTVDPMASDLEGHTMPPLNLGATDLTSSERDLLLQWVYCGAKP
jgi:uncharacterized membrane protein